jgi:hypothetical protein
LPSHSNLTFSIGNLTFLAQKFSRELKHLKREDTKSLDEIKDVFLNKDDVKAMER